jgi:hypothetical protein
MSSFTMPQEGLDLWWLSGTILQSALRVSRNVTSMAAFSRAMIVRRSSRARGPVMFSGPE